MSSNANNPLVTIGLPSYNRPDGLKRALENAINQTYQNLEIIVSDNCSDSAMNVKAVVESYMKNDKRIKFFLQPVNKGAFFNFKFLLQKATGTYFMWLADDDEKHKTFIEVGLQIIGNQGGAFGNYEVKNRYHNTSYIQQVPAILREMPLYKRLYKFIKMFPSVCIYGLFRRQSLNFFLNETQGYDFMDGHLAMHVLVNDGLNIVPTEYPITTLGINEESYVPKAFKKSTNKLFEYKPVIGKCVSIIWKSKQLTIVHKVWLVSFFMLHMLKQYITYEHPYRPIAKILNFTVRLPLRYLYRAAKKNGPITNA